MVKKIKIKEDYIKLDSLLKLAGEVNTGGHAKIVIAGGEVKVNGEVCLSRGKKVHIGETAEYNGNILVVENAGQGT